MKLQPITRANRPARKEVLMGEQQAAELIKDGDVIIVKVEEEPDCDVAIDAHDEYTVKRF